MRKIAWYYLATGLVLYNLLAACGAESTPTPIPVAATPTSTTVPTAPPTWTPAPAVTTKPATLSTPTTEVVTGQSEANSGSANCYYMPEYDFSSSIPQRIKHADHIVQAVVDNIGPTIWDTDDGRQPPGACGGGHYQFAQIELTIKENYKGTLVVGSKLAIWRDGGPGTLVPGGYDYFPKLGEPVVLFLGDFYEMRPENTHNKFSMRRVFELYHREVATVDKWYSPATYKSFSLADLKALLGL